MARVKPLFVSYNAAGEAEGVKYDRLTTILDNAVKEQRAQIVEQQQSAAQQKQLQQQQPLINDLRKLVCQTHAPAAICQR